MNKETCYKIVKDTLQNGFDKERFIFFIKNLLNEINESKAFHAHGYVRHQFKQVAGIVKTYERIGTYVDPEEKKIDLLIVYLEKEKLIDRARTSLRNFVADYLKQRGQKDAALVAFVSPNFNDWRFSLIKMDYKFEEGKSGKIKVKEEFTPARRWSFLVGAKESSHTAQSRLAPILEDDENQPALEQLEEAFNIEKVTKEFFEKYRDLFLRLKDNLDEMVKNDTKIKADFNEKDIDPVDFAKKLLGQIVFLYFLQKKGWFGVARGKNWGEGDKQFLRHLFEKAQKEDKNYFNKFLEPLFYEALRLERPKDYYDKFECRIPFLNGGLFDPLNDYDWQDTDIEIPNEIFSNKIKDPKTEDIGMGILDIFDRYNFTVKEDEPLEKEIAIDPEMLGKVFENLLEVKDRKSKGTYYTPREIVHYMCQQSLINYLATELESKVSKSDIETLVKHGEHLGENEIIVEAKGRETSTYFYKLSEGIRQNSELIDEKLVNIKVCDPAIGSGAFPVGMMSEIVKTRNVLSAYIKNKNRTIYNFKRECIEKSLYGVDIDSGAVEIAKLRLWLSLVVDEEDIEQIKPLPNLDYKIVCGDSLLGVEKDLFNSHLFGELERLKPLLFNEINPSKKQQHKKQIDELIRQITHKHKEFDFEVYFSEIFHEKKKGFDVVIANPPYVGEKGHKEIFRKVKQGLLSKFYLGKMDYFYFFFHLSLNIAKNNSSIAFITTNYYSTAMGARKLRQDFRKRAIIRNLMNFNELKIFESALGQHNMITILEKAQDENAVAQTCITQRQGIANSEALQQILNGRDTETHYYKVNQKDLYDGDEYYIRLGGQESYENSNPLQTILAKIKNQGQCLGVLCNVNNGVFAGADRLNENKKNKYKINDAQVDEGIFVLTNDEVKNLRLLKNEKGLIKPLFKNSDIKKYYTNTKNELNLINLRYTDRPNINDYPNIKNHLLKFKKLLVDRPRTGTLESALNSGYWHVMSTSRKLDFDAPKIVFPQRSNVNTFGYNEIQWYAMSDVFFITSKEEYEELNLKYILALLNSTLYFVWLYFRGKRKGEVLELTGNPISEIPVKKVNLEDQKSFIEIVDKILSITKSDDYLTNSLKQAKVRDYEKQIDQMVYKLYDLTPEEIKIVE